MISFGTVSPARIFRAVSIASRPPVGILEAGGEDALLHVDLAFVRQGVDADEEDVLLAAGGLRGQVGAVGAGIVVGVDQVDLGEAGQGRFHLLAGVGLEPLHVGLEDDLEAAARDALAETGVAVLARAWRSSGPSARRPCPCRRASRRSTCPAAWPIFLLSAPMKQVYLSPRTRRSSTMTGMPVVDGRGHGRRQRRGLLGRDDDQVHARR